MKLRIMLSLLFLTALPAKANNFNIQRWQTDTGVPVVFYQAMEVPMLDISVAFAAGSAYDQSNFGLASLTTQLMDEGNAGIDGDEIAEQIADQGAQYRSETLRDMAVFSIRSLTEPKALDTTIGIFAKIISQPDFPVGAFEQERKQLLTAIDQEQESPDNVAMIEFFKNLYKTHPYAHPVNGTAETMKAIKVKDVMAFYKKYYNTKNAVVVIVGSVTPEKAHEIANKLTQKLHAGEQAPACAKAEETSKEEQIHIPFQSAQTVIRMGQVGIDHKNPDYFPLLVGNYILGGGTLVSRLSNEIREKEGLSYGVSSQIVSMPGRGPFIIGLSTKNKQTKQALDITKNTLESYIKTGPNEQELVAAKSYLTGSYPLSLTSNRDIAALLLRMTFYHLPDDYLDTYIQNINKVTTEMIKNAFQKNIHPHKMLLVTVGKS